jgi:hypothetical protein
MLVGSVFVTSKSEPTDESQTFFVICQEFTGRTIGPRARGSSPATVSPTVGFDHTVTKGGAYALNIGLKCLLRAPEWPVPPQCVDESVDTTRS